MSGSTLGLGAQNLCKPKPRTARQITSLEQASLFLRNFLRHPLMLGSAIPSSRYLISRVLDRVDWNRAQTIVEYGPGVGTFTMPMLERMNSQSKLLAIELNREFVELLRANTNDPRLKVANGSAVEVRAWIRQHRLPQADFILSGIPYTVLPGSVRNKILTATREALANDGVFIVYQYTRAVLPDLRQVFASVEEDFEPMNILPARLFYCRK